MVLDSQGNYDTFTVFRRGMSMPFDLWAQGPEDVSQSLRVILDRDGFSISQTLHGTGIFTYIGGG